MHHPFRISFHPLNRPLAGWATRSQQAACRNAMFATTLLAERRHERIEVEEYLAEVRDSRRRAAVG